MEERIRRSLLPKRINADASKVPGPLNESQQAASKCSSEEQRSSFHSVFTSVNDSSSIHDAQLIPERMVEQTRSTVEKNNIQPLIKSASVKVKAASISATNPTKQQASRFSGKIKTEQVPTGHRRSYSLQNVEKSSSIRSRQGSQHIPMKTGRPDFAAFKQHYSPKKTELPPSQVQSLGSLAGVKVSRPSFDLQAELSYLHLLHESSASIHKHWAQSAERFHQSHFNALVERHQDVKRQQRAQHTWRNEIALSRWASRFTTSEASRQIKSLSANITLLFHLLQPDGRYSHAIDLFESWFMHAEDVRRCRGGISEGTLPTLDFIEDLGDGWQTEMTQMERRLNVCARDLYTLGDAKPGSDLARVIASCRTAAEGMLDEVRLTQAIEQGIMSQEREWISGGIGNLIQ